MSFGTNSPFGLMPVRFLTGASWNSATNTYTIDTTGGAGNIFTGDPVSMQATGNIRAAAAGSISVGLFQGCQYTASDGTVTYSRSWINGTPIAPNTVVIAYVADDPYIICIVQTNAAGAIVAANVGNTVNWAPGPGNQSTGQSGYVLDQASLGTGNNLNMKILRLDNNPQNAWGLAFNVVEVLINTHFYNAGTAGI